MAPWKKRLADHQHQIVGDKYRDPHCKHTPSKGSVPRGPTTTVEGWAGNPAIVDLKTFRLRSVGASLSLWISAALRDTTDMARAFSPGFPALMLTACWSVTV